MQGKDQQDLVSEVARLRAQLSSETRRVDPALQSVAETAGDSIVLLDAEGCIRYFNHLPGGYQPAGLGGRLSEHVPEEFRTIVTSCLERVARTLRSDRYETAFATGTGELEYWESRVNPVIQGGALGGFAVISSNVTERRAAAADRDRFFNLSIDLMCVSRMDGHITRLNPAFERVLGYSAQELLTESFVKVIHRDDRARTAEGLQRLKAGEEVLDFENRCRRKDGTYRTISWRAVGEQARDTVYAIGRDVTDRKALEAQLRHSQKMEAVGRLAGGVAHDFNNLLLAVLGNIEFARTELDPARRMEHLDEATRAARRAADLTRQLLTFSRRQPMHRTVLDLNALVHGLVTLLRRLIPADIEFDVIPGHDLAMVSADPAQLEQVILNLALNARDAMPTGGRLVIETENVLVNGTFQQAHPWAKPGRYVLLTVTDSGVGMTPDVQERVFEPFFTTKEPGKGTGLGLATVYAIVEQHSGMIHLYSEVGHGTTFKVYLPATERLADRVGPKLDARVEGGTETILIAEDEDFVRTVVTKILQNAGYRVLAAKDGKEVVSLFREHQNEIDLVLLDLVMPKQSGVVAWEEIKQMRSDVAVLFTSGYADATGISADHRNQLLHKPYEPDLMLRRIRALLDANRRSG